MNLESLLASYELSPSTTRPISDRSEPTLANEIRTSGHETMDRGTR